MTALLRLAPTRVLQPSQSVQQEPERLPSSLHSQDHLCIDSMVPKTSFLTMSLRCFSWWGRADRSGFHTFTELFLQHPCTVAVSWHWFSLMFLSIHFILNINKWKKALLAEPHPHTAHTADRSLLWDPCPPELSDTAHPDVSPSPWFRLPHCSPT